MDFQEKDGMKALVFETFVEKRIKLIEDKRYLLLEDLSDMISQGIISISYLKDRSTLNEIRKELIISDPDT